MKGERWKDIPGLEMYFKVSNYGRIRRMEYENVYPDGRVYIIPERIILASRDKSFNRFTGDYVSILVAKFTLFKHRFSFSVPRLVYYCFVKKFDLSNRDYVVICKDRNNFNIRPANLKLTTNSEKQKRTLALGRRKPLVIDEAMKRKIGAVARIVHSKEITQYTIQGKKIKTYPSAEQAAVATGFRANYIRNRVNGSDPWTSDETIWRYGTGQRIDVTDILKVWEVKKERYRKRFGIAVTQYAKNGRRIALFQSIAEASEKTGIWPSAIAGAIRKEYRSSGGFYWLKGSGPKQIDVSGFRPNYNRRKKLVKSSH